MHCLFLKLLLMQSHNSLVVSIVSHGHFDEIINLLKSIKKHVEKKNVRFVIKENKKEKDLYKLNSIFPTLNIIINKFDKIRGYGENHNFNFESLDDFSHFLIINPDVVVTELCLNEIFNTKDQLSTCRTYLNNGQISDFMRKDGSPFLTIFSYFFRSFRNKDKNSKIDLNHYWFSGAFLLVTKKVFISLKGFSKAFFMYYEDADLCRRAKSYGFNLNILDYSKIVHEGKRASIYNFKHFSWHLRSFIIYHTSKYGKTILKNLLLQISLTAHGLVGKSRRRSSLYVNPTRGIDKNIDYANSVYQDYIKVLKDIKFNLSNKKVLEVGTGSNFLVSFNLKKDCNYIKSIDVSNCLDLNTNIYNVFLENNLKLLKSVKDFMKSKVDFFSFENFKYEVVGLEKESETKFDLILSRAVFEHLDKPEESVKNCSKILNKKGVMIHEIDFRDHGIFTHFKLSPFFFYSIDSVYWKYSQKKHKGLPNRLTSHDYMQLFKKYFKNSKITKIVKEKMVPSNRDKKYINSKIYRETQERVVIFIIDNR